MSEVYREKFGSLCLALENEESPTGAWTLFEHLSKRSCSSQMAAN
jgi:hypothetical protein